MSNLARKLSTILQFLKRKFQRKPKVRRSELIQAMRGGAFRRLEPRRVLSVNATLNAGVLDINILSDDADTTASLQSASATEFFVDANNNNAHDATELRALFTDLQQINVVGDGGNTAFFWRDNFSTALLNAANANNHVVSVSNVNSFESSATATVDGNASLSAVQSLKLDGDLSIAGTLNANASNVVGTIETSANGVLNVDGAAQLSARTVNLNGTVGNNSFDDLTITSAEETTVAGAIAADRFTITASGAVEIQNAAVIEANAVEIVTQSSNADIQIDGTIRTLGNIEIDSQDSIQLSSGARLVVTGAGDLLLTANSDSVDSDGSDGIGLANGSSLSANTGAIRLTALGAGAGDVQVSSLVTNSSAVNAIEINAAANIIDNTADETSNLAAINGTIALNSLLGSIGEADDIDIDATNLIFNATGTNGVVNVSDLANGLTISGASQATRGGSITAHSPLTISANVNVGAAMVFTAGNSAAAGDSITINNNAVVTLDSVTASTLTFNAGDDIVFDSGRVVTQNGVHSVVLAADLDHAGVGAADGDRGAISQNGLAGIEVATNNLTATSASRIDLDTAVDSLVATTSDVGNILIDEQNAISLTNVATTNGSITVNAGGLITATNINAAGITGSVALTSTAGGVDVASINAASNVELTATGNVSSGVVQATNGFVKLTSTTGDALIGSITGGTTVDITATLGSINDATDDQLVDITAGGLITLKSANEIAGMGADDRLELSAGSNVAATSSTTGDVLLRGVGGLTLTNLSTQAGSIDVVAAGLIVTATVTANGAGSNASLFTSAGGISSTQVKAANSATLRATSGNVDSGSVEATAGAVTLTADSGNVIVGQTTAGTTVAVTASGLNSDVTLTNQVRSTDNLTLTAADSVRLNASAAISVTNAGDVTITANSDALDGDDADELSMQDGSTLSATTGKILLSSSGASGGNVTLGSVSTSSLAADAVVVRAGANIVDGTSAENANILATGGTIDLIALQGSIGGADDIDIDATNLVFNAAPTAIGVVNVTDLAGGVRISSASQAGGGGSMTANSPLTISANVNVGAAMVFTAGNSAAAGDSITINNNAVVTLDSVNASTLTFNAGDDIVFDSGRVVTQNGLHSVVLAADLDHAGVGAADGDRGAITQDGLVGIEVATNNLNATAATGIDLDTAIDTLQATTTSTGNIQIDEQNAITLANVSTADGAITITAGGTLTAISVSSLGTDSDANDVSLSTVGAGDVVIQRVSAGPNLGDVILSAFANIIDGDVVDDADISGNDVSLTAGGSIGGTSNDVFKGVFDPIEVTATGDLVASAVAGAIAMEANVTGTVSLSSITAYIESDGDLIAAPVFAVTNLALIADADRNGVGTLTLGPTLSVAGDLRVEGADVIASDGSIDLAANRLMLKSQSSETINVNVAVLDASTLGDLIVNSATNVELLDVDCDNVALQSLNNAGMVHLTAVGSIVVSDDVIAGNDGVSNSTGSINLYASGVNSTLTINDTVLADNGDVVLRADDDVRVVLGLSPNELLDTDNLVVITTVNGNIRIAADANGDLNAAGGELFMMDGTRIIAGRSIAADYQPGIDGLPTPSTIVLGTTAKPLGQAEVTLTADESVTVATVQTTHAERNAIRITSFNGAIVDGGDTETNLIANQIGALTTLRAANGIGNANAIETQVYAIDASNTDGIAAAQGDIAIDEVAAGGDLILVHATNEANAGQVLVRAQNGELIVPAAGFAASNGNFGVSSEQGDLLLQSMTSDVTIGSQVQSQGGNVTVNAADDVHVNASVSTQADGTILLLARNTVADAIGPAVDGVNVAAAISTVNGDLLIRSEQDVRLTATLASNSGDIGIVATRDITMDSSTRTLGNVLVNAGRDFVMSSSAIMSGGNALVVNSSRSQTISQLRATNVGLNSGANIIDANGTALNVTADNLNMQAAGAIGSADTGNAPSSNDNAIDIDVDTVAAESAAGMYLRQTIAGGNLTVGHVNAITVAVAASEVQFAAPATASNARLEQASRDDLTSNADGAIKVVVENGSLIVTEGDDNDSVGVQVVGAGAILLESRGAAADVRIETDAAVVAQSGHVSLRAADDIVLDAEVRTGASGSIYLRAANDSTDAIGPAVDGINVAAAIRSVNGDVLLSSTRDVRTTATISSTTGNIGFDVARNAQLNSTITTTGNVLIDVGSTIDMIGGASVAAGQNALLRAGAGINLGSVSAINVGLDAGADILDSNGAATNVQATNLRATTRGSIGQSDLQNAPASNGNAIDLNVVTVAAESANGIYLQEVAAGGALTVGHVDSIAVVVAVEQVQFNSTTSTVRETTTLAQLDDLTTSANGAIKVVVDAGTLTITGGTDGDNVGVVAGGVGDVLLEARGATSDIVIATGAEVRSAAGHVSLIASDDIQIQSSVSTNLGGTLFIEALNGTTADAGLPLVDGVNISAALSTENGDVLVNSLRDIRITSNVRSATGDVGLIASRDALLDANVTTAGNVLVSLGRDLTMATGTTIDANNILIQIAGNATLGALDANQVSINATGNILDGNGTAANVLATAVNLVAGGSIGTSDLANAPSANDNAIDLVVDTVAAQSASGIYIQQLRAGGDLTVGHVRALTVSVDVQQANFNSSVSPVQRTLTAVERDDLTTTGTGPIKVVTENGSIVVSEGDDNDRLAIDANGGDILLEARGAQADVRIEADATVSTAGGNVVLRAGDDVFVAAQVRTINSGTVFITAANGTADAALPFVDGINIDSSVSTTAGNILLDSSRDIRLAASLLTNSGNFGLVADGNILQLANLTTTGNVLMDADGAITATGFSTQAGTNLVVSSGTTLSLGFFGASNVSLEAGLNIDDANGGGLTKVRADQLSMRAGTLIGAADPLSAANVNLRAIELEVGTVAATAGDGIYLFEVQAGGNLAVGHVDAISVTVDVNAVHFNSSTSTASHSVVAAELDDATTDNGPIKIVVADGSLTVGAGNDGDGVGIVAGGNGAMLLEARGAGSDVVIETGAAIRSGTGPLTIVASDDVRINADLSTSGVGTIYVVAGNNRIDGETGIVMSGGSTIRTADGDVLLRANGEGNVALGLVESNRGTVSIVAEGSIVDVRFDVNVRAEQLRMIADANGDGVGAIGASETLNGNADGNANAIDTDVTTLSASAAQAIYVRELNGLIVGQTSQVTVMQANFNSSTTAIIDAARADVVTTDDGVIKLQVVAGNLIVQDGDANGVGVRANGSGDVLLQTLAADGDVLVNAGIGSDRGNISLKSGDDIVVAATIGTGADGEVYLRASNGNDEASPAFNGIDVQAVISTVDGNLLIDSAKEIRVAAELRSAGNVALEAGRDLLLQANVLTPRNLLVQAGRDVAMTATSELRVTDNVIVDATGNLTLGLIDATSVGLIVDGDIVDGNAGVANVRADNLSMVAGGRIGDSDVLNAANANANAIDLEVDTVAAQSASGIYLQELRPGGDLAIGFVASFSVTVDVDFANFNSTTSSIRNGATQNDLGRLTSNAGPIKVLVDSGVLTVTDSVRSVTTGDVLLRSATNDVVVANGATVTSGSGHISLIAADDLLLNGNVSTGANGSIYLLATNATADAVRGVDMLAGTSVTAASGNVRIVADNEGDIRLSQVSTTGDVSLIAEGSILDNQFGVNVRADSLRMIADAAISNRSNEAGQIGLADALNGNPGVNANALDTVVNTLAARSADGIYVQEFDAVAIDSTGDIAVQQVNFNSTRSIITDASLSDLRTTDAGPIKLVSSTGSITINDGVNADGVGVHANNSGDVLLRSARELVVNAIVESGSGNLTFVADDVALNANVRTAGAGQVYAFASNATAGTNDGLVMQAGVSITTAGGNVRLAADNESDVRLGLVDVASGSVSIVSEGSVIDANAASLNVAALALRVWADAVVNTDGSQNTVASGDGFGSIGASDTLNGSADTNANAIDIQVSVLAAQSADGIYIRELDGLSVAATGDLDVAHVNFNSTTSTVTDSSLSDLVTTVAGPIKLLSSVGNIEVNDGDADGLGIVAATSGDVLVWAREDLVINADVRSGSGHVTLRADDDVNLNADVFTSGGSVYVTATNDTVDASAGVAMQQGTLVSSAGGNVRVVADNEGNILLSQIDAGAGDVSLLAEGSILDNEFGVNVRADALRMVADAAISNASNLVGSIGLPDRFNGSADTNRFAINTRVNLIAARSAESMYIEEFDAVEVGATGAITVDEVRFNSTRTERSDASLSDLETTAAGSIKLVSTTGAITVNDGDADGIGVLADSSGDVLLWARQDLTVNSDVRSGLGHITLRAGDDVSLNADVSTLTGSIYITATNGTADALSGVVMQQGTVVRVVVGNVRIVADNEGDILLSQVDTGTGGDVTLLAEGSILDNEFGTNVRADALRMVADAAISNASNQAGSIGLADTLNSALGTNRFAIDTQVNRLSGRSADGIYIEEFDNVAVSSTDQIPIEEVQFESTRIVRLDDSQADLKTTDAGSIKLVSLNGSILVFDGDLDGVGVVAATTGDVLLRAQQDVIVGSDVLSGSGRIQFQAADDIDVNADVETGGSGTIYLVASNRTNDSLGTEVDGINLDGTLTTATGDLLLDSSRDVALRANILSTSGDVGVDAVRDILQSANISTGGNVVFDAGRNLIMSATNFISAGESIAIHSSGTQRIGLLTAVNVAIDADGSILDSNGGGVTNVRATNLSLRAGGSVGDSDLTNVDADNNRNAIDLEVAAVAAEAGQAIYLQEVVAGRDLTIGHVNAVTVQVDVSQVNFNSTRTAVQQRVTIAALDDLTAGGPVKVVVESGSLSVTAGTDNDGLAVQATRDGDVLLEARGATSDLTVALDADVRSNGGNVALIADDDVLLLGDVETNAATVYVRADDRTDDATSGIVMGDDAFVRTHAGSIVMEANNESNIVLGLLDTVATDFGAGSVSLRATGSILDGAGDLAQLNVQSGVLRMEADSNGDQVGSIGLASPANGNFINAIDSQVQVLAARSAEGIFIREADGVVVTATGDVGAVRVHFNSSNTAVTHASLSDLQTTNNGNITLVSDTSHIQIADGDSDLQGVIAHGLGNVLLITGALDGDMVIDANVTSDLGQITMSAGSDVVLSATVQTGRNGQSPDVLLQAVTGFIDEGRTNGDQAQVIAGSLQLQAALHAHLHDTTVNSLVAMVGKNGLLQDWQIVNDRANQRGDDFLLEALGQSRVDFARANGVLQQANVSRTENPLNAAAPQGNFDVDAAANNPQRTRYEAVERLHRFADTYAGQYALFIKNSKTLDVQLVMAGAGDNPNVYIETDGAQSDLKVSGMVATISDNATEGGIVLVAGKQLLLEGQLMTTSDLRTQLIDVIGTDTRDNFDQFGPRRSVLNATIFNGGQGIQPQEDFVSTQFVIRLNNQAKLYEDYRTHIYQRVVAHLGFENESGFMSYVGYADGNVQQFDVAGEVGVRDGLRSELNLNDQTSIQAATAPNEAVVFSRSIAFNNSFLDSNQTLPTVAIVRRADDFFLFENAAATNAEDIVDLTVEYQEVNEVRSLGGRGATVMPVDPAAPAIPLPAKMGAGVLITRPTDLLVEEIEFAAPPSGEIEVAIYRVFYEDENLNGQPEQNELPSPDEVLAAPISDDDETAELDESDSDVVQKKRYKLDSFKTTTDGSPTAEEIDELKQRLLDDAEQKTGAYSIIQKEVDGNEVVLDVFSVRDWEETPPQDQPLIQLPEASTDAKKAKTEETSDDAADDQPLPMPTDSSRNETNSFKSEERAVDSRSESRFASVGLIAGSLMMIRRSKNPANDSAIDQLANENATSEVALVAFTRQARRTRKLRGLK